MLILFRAKNSKDEDTTSSAEEVDWKEEQIQFGEVRDDLSFCDQLTSHEPPNASHFIETADQEWYTNQLSTSVAGSSSTPHQGESQDF